MFWIIIGWIAIILTATQFIPQVVKSIKTKKLNDISLTTSIVIVFTASIWILHGIPKSDAVIILANILVLISALIIVALKLKYIYSR